MSTTIVSGELPVTGSVLDNYVTMNHVPKLPRIALWAGHLYQGTVTGWVGEGATGKGLTGIDTGARVITGALMPGEAAGTTRDRSIGRVLGVWPEDDANEDLAWRWEAAIRKMRPDITDEHLAVALSLVTNMTETLDDDPFTLNKASESVASMRAVIEQYADTEAPVRFVIIDPLLAVTDDSLASNPAARRVLRPLMLMAKETGVAVLLTHHTTKDGKVAGSKGVTDVLRLVYMAEWDPRNEGVVVVSKYKGNNVGKVSPVRYRVVGDELHPRIQWIAKPAPAAPPPKPAAKPAPASSNWRARPPAAATRPSQQIWAR